MPFDGTKYTANDALLDLLMRAMEILKPKSAWIKRQLCNSSHTQFCMIGALQKASGRRFSGDNGQTHETDLERAARFALGEANPTTLGFRPIPDFNDDPRTTHEDVLLAFNNAVQLRRKQLGLP